MKQLLFLLLFPCLAMAQYQGNGNQKITLGEQTSADGLVYRGVLADTGNITPFSDTSAYIILDTVNNRFYNYNRATNVWSLAGDGDGVTSVTASLPLSSSGGTTPNITIANASTSASGVVTTGTQSFVGLKTFTSNGSSTTAFKHSSFDGGIDIQNTGSLVTLRSSQLRLVNGPTFFGADDRTYQFANIATSSTAAKFTFQYFDGTSYFERLTILPSGNVGINTASPQESLHVTGNGRFTAVGAGTFGNNLNITSDGTLTTATSDEKYKYNILPISYGLNTILDLKPVNFQWIQGEENDLGFIAQDVADIIPEAVNTNWNSDLLMRYESLIPILTKAIQEQQALIKALEQRILILENK